MNNDQIIYQLTVEDIQSVANQELERNLTSSEIKKVETLVSEKIGWYEVIAESIEEIIDSEDAST